MEEQNELKPCPFCGSNNIKIVTSVFGRGLNLAAACQDCSAGVGWFGTEEEAREAWNKRPGEDRLKGKIEHLEMETEVLRLAIEFGTKDADRKLAKAREVLQKAKEEKRG